MAWYLYYLGMCKSVCVSAYQQHLTELRERLGRSIKTSLCVPVNAHASMSAQSPISDMVAITCLVNKRSILSRSVLRTL